MIPGEKRGSVYFIGIGGTAMAGAAVMARELGFDVAGSDQNVYPPTSGELSRAGIRYHEGYSAKNLAQPPGLVIVGNAISRGNPELEAALSARMPVASLPQFLAENVIRQRQSLVIAGTHGKTTTTALLAHIMRASGVDTGYMIGGVARNFARSAEVGTADVFVIEGDEYDTSIFDHRSKFLSYRPTHVILNNIEFDHGDIFRDLADVELAFARLIKIIPQNGLLVTNGDNESCVRLAEKSYAPVVLFGKSENSAYRLLSLEASPAGSLIHASCGEKTLTIDSPLFGEHNALNVLAALALAEKQGVSFAHFQAALKTFLGVRRRLEQRFENAQHLVIEDFAHHPTAIAANLKTLRQIYPGRRLVVLIEPRSNTMVRNIFQAELASALSEADAIFTDSIYRPEKYRPDERLDIERLVSDLTTRGRTAQLLPVADRVQFLLAQLKPGDVICFMTNGSFGGLIGELVTALETL